MRAELDRPVVFFAGKGGVGKTTSAALCALAQQRAGRRTLLVSTDPAHNLSDVFTGAAPSAGEARPAGAGLEGLWVLEVDIDRETRRYLDEVKGNIRRLVRSSMLAEAERQIDLAGRAPGAAESALLERLVAVLLDARGHYDRIVFDTAPTGHTLRLLSMPQLMGAWVDGLLRRRAARHEERAGWLAGREVPEDPVYALLQRRRDRLTACWRILADPALTAFVMVLIPESLPIAETTRAIEELEVAGLSPAMVVVNRVMPARVSDPFFAARQRQQAECLQRIDRVFADRARLRLPLLAGEVASVQALESLLPALD